MSRRSTPPETPPASPPPPHAPTVPPQAPVAGRLWRRVLGRFHLTGAFWYRFHRWGAVDWPLWTVRWNVPLYTVFFFLALRGIVRAIASNLDAVLGPAGWLGRQRRAWKTLLNQAWCNTERFERLETDRPFDVEVEGTEHWFATAGTGEGDDARPEGFVLVTAHVGSWDVSSFVPSLVATRHVHIVREQEMDPEAQEFTEEMYRRAAGAHFTTHFARDNPQLGATLLAALRRGDVVGLQGDRPSTTGRKVETTLFGRPFVLPVGPAALARAAGAPMLPVFCFREGRRRYRLVIRPPIEPPRTDDRDRDHEEIMQRMVSEIEWAIRREPFQWFCFRELW